MHLRCTETIIIIRSYLTISAVLDKKSTKSNRFPSPDGSLTRADERWDTGRNALVTRVLVPCVSRCYHFRDIGKNENTRTAI